MTEQNANAGLSPLERAKALLKQAHSGATPTTTSPAAETETSSPSPTADSSLSPLERAKALLQQSKSSVEKTSQDEESTAQQQEETLSPLERAKALLKQPKEENKMSSQEETSADTESKKTDLSALERAKSLLKSSVQTQSESAPAAEKSDKPMSALDRAKALLSSAKQSNTPEPVNETQETIAMALKGAEAMVDQLKATADAARAHVAAQKENLTSIAQEAGAPSPADLLCERGEAAFEGGDESQAATLFDSALLVDPSSVRALNNLGVMALHSDDPWRALSYLLMGVIQSPSNEDVIINLQGLFDLYPEMKTARSVIFD